MEEDIDEKINISSECNYNDLTEIINQIEHYQKSSSDAELAKEVSSLTSLSYCLIYFNNCIGFDELFYKSK